MFINNEEICFKLNTGAETNILPVLIFARKKLYELYKLGKIEIILISYGNHKLKPEDCVDLLCSIDKCKNVFLKFVVNIESKPIFGSTCMQNKFDKKNRSDWKSKQEWSFNKI